MATEKTGSHEAASEPAGAGVRAYIEDMLGQLAGMAEDVDEQPLAAAIRVAEREATLSLRRRLSRG